MNRPTKEQGQSLVRYTYVERDLIKSEAFRKLTGQSRLVLFLFYLKLKKRKTRRKGKEQWLILNNDELQFTFKEAKEKYGLSKGQFERALDQLYAFGFIEVTLVGNAARRLPTLYGVRENWREYGKPEFVQRERPKDSKRIGFRGKRLGATAKRKKKRKTGVRAVEPPAGGDL